MHSPNILQIHHLSLFFLSILLNSGLANISIAQAFQEQTSAADTLLLPGIHLYDLQGNDFFLLSRSSSIRMNFFTSYRDKVSEKLQEGSVFRMPSNLYLLDTLDNSLLKEASLQIIPFPGGGGLMVNLNLCQDGADIAVCLVGYFSTVPLTSQTAQTNLAAHQSIGYPITLAPGIQAYLREYQDGPIAYASLMWEQDEQLYRIQLPVSERQNMLYMALEMINSEPLYPSGFNSSLLSTKPGRFAPKTTFRMISSASRLSSSAEVNPPIEPMDIDKIYIEESSLFSNEEIRRWLAQIQALNRNATITDFADRITQEYINRGYITTSAVVIQNRDDIPFGFDNGIGIVEGFISNVEVVNPEESASEFENYIRSRLELVGGPPLNLDRLEEKLRLLRLNPLFENIEATLRDSGEKGGSILTVRVTRAQPLVFSASINNDSAPSIGAEQFEIDLTYLNPGGFGGEHPTYGVSINTRG